MKLRILAFFFFCANVFSSYAQDYWRPLEGPTGISIRNVATDTAGNVYFSSPEFGVFRSIDDGENWDILNEGLIPDYYSVFTFVPSPDGRMYAYNRNVFYRLNPDQTAWDQLTLPISSWTSVYLNDEGELFFSDSNGNVFKSFNGGLSYQQVLNEDQLEGTVRKISIHGDGKNFIVSDHGSSSNLYRFSDNGSSIELLFSATNLVFLDFYYDNINNTLLFSTGNGLFISTDEGVNWVPVVIDSTQTVQPYMQQFRRHTDGNIYAFANSKFAKTTDGGEIWTLEDPFNLPTTILGGSSFACHGDNNLYWTNLYCEKQIFVRSTDGGQTWDDLTAIFKQAIVKKIMKDDTGILFAKTCQQEYFIFSEDDGVNWFNYTINGGLKVRELVFNSANHYFAITENDSLYRSTNNGASWTHLELEGLFAYFGAYGHLVMSPSDDIFITIMIRELGMLKSSDSGETFDQIHPGFLIEFPENITFHPNGNIFYGGDYISLNKSTDGGYHWEEVTSNSTLVLNTISKLHINTNGTLFIQGGNLFYGNNGMYISPDEGLTLTSNSISDDYNRVFDIESNPDGEVFCTTLSGVYRSTNDGDSWTSMNNGLPAGNIGRHLYIDNGGNLYLGINGDVIYKSATVLPGTNRIYGRVWNDETDDCLYDSEPTLKNWIITATGDNDTFYASTDENGYYELKVAGGDYEVSLSLPNDLWERCFVQELFSFPSDGSTNSAHLDFPVQPRYQCPYMSVEISTPSLKRCQESIYTVRYCNVGTANVDDAFVEITLDPFLEFISAEISPHSIIGNVYTFQIGTVIQGDCGAFKIRTSVSCEAALGQEHCVYASLFPDFLCLLDADLLFLSSECRQNESDFLEPNSKLAFVNGTAETERVLTDNDFIAYHIRFQNTGTDTVFQVVVEDQLSTHLDPGSIVPGVSSHPYSFGFSENGNLVFTFEDILLPPSSIDEMASWGFIKFKINQKENLPIGTEILNFANIYFDSNPSSQTNLSRLTVEQVDRLNKSPNDLSTTIRVAPNPAKSYTVFEIATKSPSKFILQMINTHGQLVRTENFEGTNYHFEKKNLPSGLYFYKISDENGFLFGVGKLILD